MDYKFVLFLVLLVLGLFLFGCTGTVPVCGDGICSVGEELTCVNDCGGGLELSSLEIGIAPGMGATENDLDVFKGKNIFVCEYGVENSCKSELVDNNLIVSLDSYAKGYYILKGVFDLNGVPVSLDSTNVIYVSSDSNFAIIRAYVGISYDLIVVEDSIPVSSSEIKILNYCEYSSGAFDECVGREGVAWDDVFLQNPFTSTISLDSESNVYSQLSRSYSIKLEYNGVVKDFNYKLDQGQNEIIFNFENPDNVFSARPWGEAVATCELYGRRLPTLNEYCPLVGDSEINVEYWTSGLDAVGSVTLSMLRNDGTGAPSYCSVSNASRFDSKLFKCIE